MHGVGEAARAAARELARADTAAKNRALHAMAAAIRRDEARAPRRQRARTSPPRSAAGHDAAFVDRLTLTPKTIAAMADGLEEIAALPDPVGEITDLRYRPTGIQVGTHARAARRGRHHLRIAAQRDRRRRGPVPQGGQRDDPARRLRGDAQQPGDRRAACTRACAPRACRSTPCRSSPRPIAPPSAI